MEALDLECPLEGTPFSNNYVQFNNQSTVLLDMYVPGLSRLYLLHDNRCYAFDRLDGAATSGKVKKLILELVTTLKYRILNTFYLVFLFLNDANLLLLFLLSFVSLDAEQLIKFEAPNRTNLVLAIIMGLEFFYDIMLLTHRFWNLQRLSIYIALVLYAIYTSLLLIITKDARAVHKEGDILLVKLNLVWYILGTRFVAFLLEECVDVSIDAEIHNDLLEIFSQKKRDQKDDAQEDKRRQGIVNQSFQSDEAGLDLEANRKGASQEQLHQREGGFKRDFRLKTWLQSKYTKVMNVQTSVRLPAHVQYVGSILVWRTVSVYSPGIWRTTPIPRWILCLLCGLPLGIALFLTLAIGTICLIAVGIALLWAGICLLGVALVEAIRLKRCETPDWKEISGKLRVFVEYWSELTQI